MHDDYIVHATLQHKQLRSTGLEGAYLRVYNLWNFVLFSWSYYVSFYILHVHHIGGQYFGRKGSTWITRESILHSVLLWQRTDRNSRIVAAIWVFYVHHQASILKRRRWCHDSNTNSKNNPQWFRQTIKAASECHVVGFMGSVVDLPLMH